MQSCTNSDQIYNNTINVNVTNSNTVAGIYFNSNQYGIQTNGNDITVSTVGGTQYGIYHSYVYYEDGTTKSTILNNKIALNATGAGTSYGIWYEYSWGSSLRNLIANNFISQKNGTGTTYGIYFTYNSYADVQYNSINITGGNSTSAGLYFVTGTTTPNTVYNNIVTMTNPTPASAGYTIYVSAVGTPGFDSCNYNCLYTTSTTNFAYWGATNANIGAWRTAAGLSRDSRSINILPTYTSSNDLHTSTAALNAGKPGLTAITTDIDGETRAQCTTLPYIGADEYVAPLTYSSSTTAQTDLTDVTPGTNDKNILQIAVTASGCLTSYNQTMAERVRRFTFNTNGSTSASGDILKARIYYTGNSNTFAATNQFGADTSSLPSGSTTYNISGSQLLLGGINYFWLVYDITSSATVTNVVDAECPSILFATSGSKAPTVTAPTGTRTISNTKVLNSIAYNQAGTTDVVRSSTDVPILRVDVNVTGTSGTLYLNSLIATSGNTNDADIASSGVKLYSTSTTTFATTNLIATGSFAAGTATLTPTGGYSLPSGNTYLWVTYDVTSSAGYFNTLDAKIAANGISIGAYTYPASLQNPNGSRTIAMNPFTLPYFETFEKVTTPTTYTTSVNTITSTPADSMAEWSFQSTTIGCAGQLRFNAINYTPGGMYSATIESSILFSSDNNNRVNFACLPGWCPASQIGCND